MSAILLSRPAVANIYNPQNQSKEQLIESFVVRQQLFKKLFKVIKEAKMEVPEQHYLLLGRRGMGKTTLLLRLAYEIEDTPELNGWLIPLVFNEEEYGIRSLYKFWERVMQLLEDKHSAFSFEEETLRQMSRQYPNDHDAYEKALFEWLSGELKRNGKKLILFIDNFGEMTRKLSEAEARRLRKILQTNADLRIIAASSVVLEAFYKYDHPFYEFFKTEELKGLNEKETRELLLSLSEHYKKDEVRHIVENNPGRVEALRRITGGVARSIVLLFEIFADDKDGSAFHDLQIILDRVSPLYKHRMDELSDQQQAIVETIALNWDAISVKEIAEQTRLESKIVSAQLGTLEKTGIIEKRPTRTKNHLYLISERFFNIWFLMRLGRKSDQKRVLWLVRFFEDWCDKDLMKSRIESHMEALLGGKFDIDAAFYITQAMAGVKHIDPVMQHKMLDIARSYLSKKDNELAESLSQSDMDLAVMAIEKWHIGEKKEAIKILNATRMASNNVIFMNLTTIGDKEIKSFSTLSNVIGNLLYYKLQNTPAAQKCYEIATEAGNVDATFNLGLLLLNEGSNIGASYVTRAAEQGHGGASYLISSLALKLKKNKEMALHFAIAAYQLDSEIIHYSLNYACILLWNDQVKEAFEVIPKFVLDKKLQEEKCDDFFLFCTLLLAKNQAQALYNLFTSPQGQEQDFKDRFKPIWYAILKKLDHADFLRMGDELSQTVEEVLAKAEQMAIDYK